MVKTLQMLLGHTSVCLGLAWAYGQRLLETRLLPKLLLLPLLPSKSCIRVRLLLLGPLWGR